MTYLPGQYKNYSLNRVLDGHHSLWPRLWPRPLALALVLILRLWPHVGGGRKHLSEKCGSPPPGAGIFHILSLLYSILPSLCPSVCVLSWFQEVFSKTINVIDFVLGIHLLGETQNAIAYCHNPVIFCQMLASD